MIKYEWRDHLSAAEANQLADLLARAAAYDAEPEYSVIEFTAVRRDLTATTVRHLVIWMLPHAVAMELPDEPERIAGLLRIEFTSDTAAEATVVIDPRYRAIGIMTLLLEQVGVDADSRSGWMGSGARSVTAWARGNHPATGRISNRFLLPRTRRVWKLIRPVGSAEEATAAPVLESLESATVADIGWAQRFTASGRVLALREAGSLVGLASLDLQAVDSPEFGTCATIACVAYGRHAETGAIRRMLTSVAAAVDDAGLDAVAIYVDSDDTALVNACRLSGFQHDRTDVCYQLGGSR